MKKVIGILLIILGIAFLFIEDFTFTQEETVLDAGDVEITRDDEQIVPVRPVIGVIFILGGAALLIYGFQTE
ncbi:MAG: hypothetical protein WD266_07890 [Balneolales bacterium]